MTFLYPVPLPGDATLDTWTAFVRESAADFFAAFCSEEPFDSVCMMLMPKPKQLPLVAIEDDYDCADSLIEQITRYAEGPPPGNPTPNAEGQIVIAWPFSSQSSEHRAHVHAILQSIAADTNTVATALVYECWLRTDLTAPRGTGEDNLLAVIEQIDHEPRASIAKITTHDKQRRLHPWSHLAGVVAGAFSPLLPARVPDGFTAKVNVATVGVA